MKVFGNSPEQYENNRIKLLRLLKVSRWVLLSVLLAPVVLVLLFQFKVLTSISPFSRDIQEPVAKVISKTGTGTAFLVSPTKLLTAAHILGGLKVGDEVDLIFERVEEMVNTTAKIKYIGQNEQNMAGNQGFPLDYFLEDFAVLELSTPSEIPPILLGESEAVNLLDEVILIGYPLGDFSITTGNINNDKYNDLDLFKLDAPSNPGNSGGPCILKLDNSVIGILVGGQESTQGQNIAIKINNIRNKLADIGIDISD